MTCLTASLKTALMTPLLVHPGGGSWRWVLEVCPGYVRACLGGSYMLIYSTVLEVGPEGVSEFETMHGMFQGILNEIV